MRGVHILCSSDSHLQENPVAKKAVFETVTRQNAKRICGTLASDGGIIVVVNWHNISPPVLPICIEFLVNPTIRLEHLWIDSATRRSELVDREYRFSLKRPKDSLDGLFESVPIGEQYVFTIGHQPGGSRQFLAPNDTTLFVPRKADLSDVFGYLFRRHPFARALGITEAEAETLIRYIMDDLRTKSVLRKNIVAGEDADAMLGM